MLMNRTIRTTLLLLAAFSCSQPDENKASDADWRQWNSLIKRAERSKDSTSVLADSAIIFARSHGMSDTGLYRPWELKAQADRDAQKIQEAKSWLDSALLHASDAGHAAVEARILNATAQLLLQSPQWEMAEMPLRDAMEMADDDNLTAEKPYLLLSWASFLRRKGKASNVMDTLELAEQLFRNAGNRRFLGQVYQLRGEMQQGMRDPEGALSSFRASLIELAAIGDTIYMSRPYRRIAGLLLDKNPDSATYYFKASLETDPTHQFVFSYISGLTQFATFYLSAGNIDKAMPYIDSAIQFSTKRNNYSGAWNAWLCKGVAHLLQNDTTQFDSAMKNAVSIAMDNGMFIDFTGALKGWRIKFKKQGQPRFADKLALWADPQKIIARKDFEAAQPKQVAKLSETRRAAIQKSKRNRLALGIGSVVLILLVGWRINVRHRNNNFTLFRERAAALAAARTYRKNAIANADANASEDGTQLIIDRERRVLALEVLFETEKLYQQPDLSFSDVCTRLQEPEAAFRTIVKKMYDVEFETWLEEWRIEEATRQLNDGADLSTLHTTCGFRDAANFRKTFEKVTGLKPGSYLKWPKPPIR
jgi:AraC-like DNA-binding protein